MYNGIEYVTDRELDKRLKNLISLYIDSFQGAKPWISMFRRSNGEYSWSIGSYNRPAIENERSLFDTESRIKASDRHGLLWENFDNIRETLKRR